MIVEFKYYLHDDYTSHELKEYIQEQIEIEISDDLMDKMGEPFYEIELHCTLDTETGYVQIVSAR